MRQRGAHLVLGRNVGRVLRHAIVAAVERLGREGIEKMSDAQKEKIIKGSRKPG